jgi:hypothetical protein
MQSEISSSTRVKWAYGSCLAIPPSEWVLIPLSDPSAVLNVFLMLAMAHFLGDFGLQSDRMAREKCPGCGVTLGWGWWLTSHAAIHGCLVGAITQSPLLGVAELIAHLLIDFGKPDQQQSAARPWPHANQTLG